MTKRYLDWTILDKLKHLREVDFYKGTVMESDIRNTNYEDAEQDIKTRYSEAEIKAMKRHGFSGCSFEVRAKAVGLVSMYSYCYRIASRNIHLFDPADTLLHEDFLPSDERKELLKARRIAQESIQNMLLGRFAYAIDMLIGSPLAAELILLGIGYEKFRDNNDIGVSSDEPFHSEDTDGEELYIWRE